MVNVNYRDSRPIYVQIKESIIRQIMTGALSPDEKMQSVRELAVELAINPNTIQRAYRELENEGYIYVVPGKGTFVSPYGEAKADVEKLTNEFRQLAAKLIFNGESSEKLKAEIDSIYKEVSRDD
ncbi:MAG: GntR family transcriptional regulator [Ruminococcaceae bacterium]|nr:GntR family transcriptional regulator [Oscillospiraceae bacterium]